ncbi:MAG: sarcosine oxidase subunit delta [Phyllobacteriaceae bacterium]|nr:sarcosine oxidase subunit delta [Phyllobacteriaceae bacterium]
MLITCPHCGQRPVEEFTFNGDAKPQRPTSNDPATMEQWFDYVYLRDNPRGFMDEYTHHSGGCRAWLVVTRNTETHEIASVVTARDYGKKRRKA